MEHCMVLAAARKINARKSFSRIVMVLTLLPVLSFMAVVPGGDAMSSGASASRVWELALCGLAVTIGIYLRSRGQYRMLPGPAMAALILNVLFTIWALFTVLWSPLILIGIGRCVQMIIVILIGYFIVSLPERARNTTTADTVYTSMTVGLLIAIAFLLVANIALFKTPIPMQNAEAEEVFSGSLRPRFFLGYNHPLETASLLAMTIVFVANARFRKAFRFSTMGVLAGLLYLTDGRTATAATAVALMVMIFLSMRPSPFKIMLGMSCLGAGLVGLLGFLLSGQVDRMLGTAIGEDVFTLNGRVALWEFALQSWADSPLIGVGYYATRVILLPMFPFAGHTHNSLIEILLSTGLVGALLSLAFLAISVHAAVITKDRTHIGILILMIADGSLNPLLFTPSTTHLLLLVTTMNAYTVHARRRAARPAPVPLSIMVRRRVMGMPTPDPV
jgi:O-antigen ligase